MNWPFSSAARQRFVQNAYHVGDLDEAIMRWHRLFGIGPFIVRRNIALGSVHYRGAPSELHISAAHAQAGPVQIELIVQHCDTPSTFRDMYKGGEEGIHHVALFPEDHDAMVAHYAAQGCAVTTDIVTAEGRGASYVDCRQQIGHMIEIYRVNQSLFDFYDTIADAAARWDGRQLVIEY
ncbi:VOC family protein [Sphingosinicella microcystinivorans]|uniref:VOC family protein n=1 Tax=Sphingosinicella microcystinivorans TaxID=335406 RepID=UPI001356ECDA|nr:VOC family protein [Sphingosinicella microcystinivorans]